MCSAANLSHMGVKTGANTQVSAALSKRAQESAVYRPSGWASALCGAVVSLATLSSAFAAEGPMLLLEAVSPAPILAYASLVATPSPPSLWNSARTAPIEAAKLDIPGEESPSNSLQWQSEPDLRLQYSLLVDPPGVGSPLSYLTWAARYTGVGEYYLTDVAPRLRTNGAGV